MLHRLLHSEDRFQILRGLEILGSLATVESNEEILVNALGNEAFNRITELLTGETVEDWRRLQKFSPVKAGGGTGEVLIVRVPPHFSTAHVI